MENAFNKNVQLDLWARSFWETGVSLLWTRWQRYSSPFPTQHAEQLKCHNATRPYPKNASKKWPKSPISHQVCILWPIIAQQRWAQESKALQEARRTNCFCVHIEVLWLPAVRQILLCSRYPFENLIMKIIPTPARGFFSAFKLIQFTWLWLCFFALLTCKPSEVEWGHSTSSKYVYEKCLICFLVCRKKYEFCFRKYNFPGNFHYSCYLLCWDTHKYLCVAKSLTTENSENHSANTRLSSFSDPHNLFKLFILESAPRIIARTHTTHCTLAVCVVFYSLNDASITTCGWNIYYSFLQENDFNRKSNNEIMCNSQGTCDCVFRNNYASLMETFRHDSTSSLLQDC